MMYGPTLSKSLSTNEITPLRKPSGVRPLPAERTMRPQVPHHLPQFSQSFFWKAPQQPQTNDPGLAKCHGLLVTSSAHKPLVETSHRPLARSLFPSAPKMIEAPVGLGWSQSLLERKATLFLSVSYLLSWAQYCVEADVYQLLTADCAHIFPTACSVIAYSMEVVWNWPQWEYLHHSN